MRIGLMAGATPGDGTIDGLVKRARDLEARGFHSLWMAHIMGLDAISTLGIVGRETKSIELGTAVVPSYSRHPMAMAQQALTTQAAAKGRFVLGIGLSHKLVIEDIMGLSYTKPARHMREYMGVLAPLLRGEPSKYAGEEFKVNVTVNVEGAEPVPVLIAALGDLMLKIAGQSAAGTILWMTGPKTIESHIAPKIQKAASEAGRPAPRIVAGLPIVLTNNVDAVRERIAKSLTMYGMLPSYRAMLDKEGAAGPANIAIVGDEKALGAQLDRLRDVGVTDFDAALMGVEDGAQERTLDFLQSRL